MLHRVVWQILANLPEKLTTLTIGAIIALMMKSQHYVQHCLLWGKFYIHNVSIVCSTPIFRRLVAVIQAKVGIELGTWVSTLTTVTNVPT
jgi:hypothetical protein